MTEKSREFQIFAKPVGSSCNLACRYCYYLDKKHMYGHGGPFRMSDIMLENYIKQHIEASTEETINFSWHGGEPTLAGLDFFRKAVEMQQKHNTEGRLVVNGIQTNGTLLNEEWGSFLHKNNFLVGISMDGPSGLHDTYRISGNSGPTFTNVLHGYELLKKHNVVTEILCVVNAANSKHPLQVYRFFKELGAKFITFLPCVERLAVTESQVSALTVNADEFGNFMIQVFDEWVEHDIGGIKVQLFEEAARTAFRQEHTLCIFKNTCGGVPVIEYNGDFYSCDHYVDSEHHLGNINDTSLADLLDSEAQMTFGRAKLMSLPKYCQQCEVIDMCNGECPKNRFIHTPDGDPGLNYLCSGYKKFFSHCKPFVETIASVWKERQKQARQSGHASTLSQKKTGRNDPCPCGSGKKYKNCCMGQG